VRVYPALRITFFEPPSEEQIDFLLAQLDDFRPTAIDDIEKGVIAYFGNASVRDDALARLGAYELVDVTAEDVSDENWAERSQAALTPVTVGRLTIAPPWTVNDELRATAPGPIIVILPSMGFGTGHHASTRLCLELLQRVPVDGQRVLDIGTGSGVLAIAARILGAASVVGIDVDPDAITNARENLELNGVSDGVTFFEADVQTHALVTSEAYDLILANLTGSLLQREAHVIAACGARGGHAIVSGFQVHEVDDVRSAFESTGWIRQDHIESESWVALQLARSATVNDADARSASRSVGS
jgi:ribosomal protein L11 methyltransferase